MPTLATPPLALLAPAVAYRADPPGQAMLASATLPLDAQAAGWLHALLYRGWQFARQELPVNAAALAAFLVQQTQEIMLKQAMASCTGLVDWAVHSISQRLVDPPDQMPFLGDSLLRAAVTAMPSSQQVCKAALSQLQVQAMARLTGLQTWGSDGAHPADSATGESASTALALSTHGADPWSSGTHPPSCALADADLGWPPPDHALDMLPVESIPAEASDSVCLVGDGGTSSFIPLL